jgi:predicted DNA-binding transcriptional regulator AlpA
MKSNDEHVGGLRDRLVRLPELETRFGVCKRTIQRQSEKGELPRLYRIGRAVGMRESEVNAYFDRLGEHSPQEMKGCTQ